MSVNYEFFHRVCQRIIQLNGLIRWVGVTNSNGVILSQEYRRGIVPLLSEEENEEYAEAAITRRKTRTKFEVKIGQLKYAFGRYEKLLRATIGINEYYYILITLDVEAKGFDDIIMEKIIPFLQQNKDEFTVVNQ